jgi:hypothetical protein
VAFSATGIADKSMSTAGREPSSSGPRSCLFVRRFNALPRRGSGTCIALNARKNVTSGVLRGEVDVVSSKDVFVGTRFADDSATLDAVADVSSIDCIALVGDPREKAFALVTDVA